MASVGNRYEFEASGFVREVSRAWRVAGFGGRDQLRLVTDQQRHQWMVVHKTSSDTSVDVYSTAKDALVTIVETMRASGQEWVEIGSRACH